jgi:hypothetical protein
VAQRVSDGLRQPGVAVVWLEKCAIFKQTLQGVSSNVDHMLLAEVAPSRPSDLFHVAGFRGSEQDSFVQFGAGDRLVFVNEWYLDRKARSFDTAEELEREYPNTQYRFVVEDVKGRHELILAPGGTSGRTCLPEAPRIALEQQGRPVLVVDDRQPLRLSWSAFSAPVEGPSAQDLLGENAIFVLLDNGRGETVFTSGSGQKGPALSWRETYLDIPAGILEPGMKYTAFVSLINFRSSDVAQAPAGPLVGVAVNAVSVEMPFVTLGEARNSRECPPLDLRANYRWPGKLSSATTLTPWPVDASGLRLRVANPLSAGCD